MELFKLPRRTRKKITEFRNLRDGVSAIEFALVGLPFLILLFAIIETGYVFLLAILLEGATADGARLIRTAATPTPQATFQTRICDSMYGMLPCASLNYDVNNFTSFSGLPSLTTAVPTAQGTTYSPGVAGDIVVVRVTYRWTFITPLLENLLGADAYGVRRLLASAVFRNEPA